MAKRPFTVAICLCLFALIYCRQAETQTQPSGKALLEAYVSAWNRRDFVTLDKLLAPEALHEDMARPSRDIGPAQINQSIRATIEAQPDLNWHLTSIVDGGSVVARNGSGQERSRATAPLLRLSPDASPAAAFPWL